MRSILFAVVLAVVGFVVGAFLTPVGQGGFDAVWTFFSRFDMYPDLLNAGMLTYPLIGAAVGAVAGFVLGRLGGKSG
jgi:hypothetical protein